MGEVTAQIVDWRFVIRYPTFVIVTNNPQMDFVQKRFCPVEMTWALNHELMCDVHTMGGGAPQTETIVGNDGVDVVLLNKLF